MWCAWQGVGCVKERCCLAGAVRAKTTGAVCYRAGSWLSPSCRNRFLHLLRSLATPTQRLGSVWTATSHQVSLLRHRVRPFLLWSSSHHGCCCTIAALPVSCAATDSTAVRCLRSFLTGTALSILTLCSDSMVCWFTTHVYLNLSVQMAFQVAAAGTLCHVVTASPACFLLNVSMSLWCYAQEAWCEAFLACTTR